jgi:hypothetical protein
LSNGRIEKATFKAVIERSGNSYAGWSLNWEDNVARDDKTHRSAKKNVAGKMITGGDTGEADGASQAIGEEGNPAMLAIPVGKDGFHGRSIQT